jgi:hypothetical protein
VAVVFGIFLTAASTYYPLVVYFITYRIKMNESVKAICCHGSGAFNEDPHTISGNHGHKPQCCHVSRVLFNVSMAQREGENFPDFIKQT